MGGSVEYPVADGKGTIYDNNEAKHDVGRRDTRTFKIKARCLSACRRAHGHGPRAPAAILQRPRSAIPRHADSWNVMRVDLWALERTT
jgi:hypothetical protein